MFDAPQRADVTRLLDAAVELVGRDALGDVLNVAQTLAAALTQRGVYPRPQAEADPCDLCPMRVLH